MSDHTPNLKEIHGRRTRKDIYFLPSMFTTGSLFAGFFAIVKAINGDFEASVIALYIAMFLDGIDGRVARWTHTESEFGAQYDSIVDMVSFGLAPALIMYQWALSGLGKMGWLAAFVYSAGAGMRLARFNARDDSAEKHNFFGLPSPAAAALIVGFVWAMYSYGFPGRDISILGLIMTLTAGVLMVSNVRYRSFKDLNARKRIPFMFMLIIPLVFVLIYLGPPEVLFGGALAYAASGPLMFAIDFMRGNKTEKQKKEEEGSKKQSSS